jgi:uncharacterized protein YndB with AHSA1/START domain
MTFDLTAHMNAMTRVVKNLERDGKPAKAVLASCIYETDAADLWDALTNKERLPRWFSSVSGDFELGGRFHVENNASGTITECVPNQKIAATWEFGGGISWITVTLSPEGNRTRLQLEHVSHIDPHWERFGPGAVGVGWDLGFMGLARHIAEPSAARPPEADESWFATAEAKDFIRGSSDDWGRAAIAAGEPEEHALEAAENTRKFYTGEAPPPEM